MAATSPSIGQVLGHFRLLERIGEGGMGIVFRARDTRLERDVAIKVLNQKTLRDASGKRRFRREALVLSRLNHPNVEVIYEFPANDSIDYIVMEYVPGTSLDDRLRRGAMAETEVLELGVQLARGLAAAHARGIIHRDLKPGNLRVTPERVLKILDFGLAQLFALPDDETVTASLPIDNSIAGTLPYMAPEQLQGKPPDTRSDVYSAGVVLYEMSTGRRPFADQGALLRQAILASAPKAPREAQPKLSPKLERAILRCLEKDPNARFQSASELLAELAVLAAEENVSIASKSGRHTIPSVSKRVWTSVSAVVVVLATAGVFLFWRTPQAQAHHRVMAVLPFDEVGQSSATSALDAGLMETVASKLVEAGNDETVQVVAPHELREKGVKSAADARREFGTDMVLEGSLQQSGQELRITCNLVDSRTGRQITARTLTRDANDIFTLQDETVKAAWDMLQAAHITVREQQPPVSHPGTAPAAYEAYVRGRGYLQEYENPDNIGEAVKQFQNAISLDPRYAAAYAGLGEAYWRGYDQLHRGEDWLKMASESCSKATTIDPQLGEGRTCLGNIALGQGHYEEAVELYRQALTSSGESENTLGQLALAYEKLGNAAAAEATYKQAVELRPHYWAPYNWFGTFYLNQGRYAEAVAAFKKVIELAPDNHLGYSNLGAVYLYMGRDLEAIAVFKRSIDLKPSADGYSNLGEAHFCLRQFPQAIDAFKEAAKLDDQDWLNWGNLGDALYWTPGRQEEAGQAYRRAVSLARARLRVDPRDGRTLAYVAVYESMTGNQQEALQDIKTALILAPSNPDVMFRAALVYNRYGNTDQTIGWLERSEAAGWPRVAIRDTPDFDHLRKNVRFRALLPVS